MSSHMISTHVQRIVKPEFTKFAVEEVIFSSKLHQKVDIG